MHSTITIPDRDSVIGAFSVADEKISEWSAEFMPLTISDVSDTAALKVVHDARMRIRNARVAVEKKRKELKADALKYGSMVDAEAKRITELLNPIEAHLTAEEDRVNAERERIRLQKIEAARAATQARVDALTAVGCVVAYADAQMLKESDYQAKLAEATETHRVEQERLAAAEAEQQRLRAEEDARRQAESDRLAAERAELDRIREAQEAEAANLAAERQRLVDEEAARVRAAEVEQARVEAAEQARIATEQRIAREAEQAKARAEAEAAERARVEALRPDREKLLAVAHAVAQMAVPSVSPAAAAARHQVMDVLEKAAAEIQRVANSLTTTPDDDLGDL